MIPDELQHGAFRLFPSSRTIQGQADEFLLQAGLLEKAERLLGWMKEGLVSSRLDKLPRALASGIRQVLVLKSENPAIFREIVSLRTRRWMSDLQVALDERWEGRLAEDHARLSQDIEKSVRMFQGWGIAYSTTKEIDEHFLEWGQVYLRRMWSQDLLGLDDVIGGHQFNEYLGVLAALSGRAQKHLCFAAILKQRHPQLDLRNLLTTFAPYSTLVKGLAEHLDADTVHVQNLLESLTLSPSNRNAHTSSSETAWAPVVRSSHDHCILLLYGLEINPFLFLLDDLEAKFPRDWFRVANNREGRWLVDLRQIFPAGRWSTIDRNLNLRMDGRIVTDIDFLAYDRRNNELAIFQLKWQRPIGMDNRARRSAGKNLLAEGNRWIEAILGWLSRQGVEQLANRAAINLKPAAQVRLFVIARYSAFFSGFGDQDDRATWADWNHLMKARMENPNCSVCELAELLKTQVAEIATSYTGESYVVPLGDLAVILNPTSEPSEETRQGT